MLTFFNNFTVEGQKVQHTSTAQLCLSMQDEVRAAFSLSEVHQC